MIGLPDQPHLAALTVLRAIPIFELPLGDSIGVMRDEIKIVE